MNLVYIGTCVNGYLNALNNYLSIPMLVLVFGAGIIMTFAFNFVQFRYFFTSWSYIFHTRPAHGGKTENISPFQAFLGTLSTSMGNGSLAGMGVAMYEGGPGAALWVFVLGFFTMVLRFAEIYASTEFTVHTKYGIRGGPMAYLSKVPGGSFLPYVYALFALLTAIITGNAMQCNTMAQSIHGVIDINPYIIALVLFIFVLYVVFGGAHRIIKFSDTLAPIKVVLFCAATIAVLIYFWAELPAALALILTSAFSSKAVVGGVVGYTMGQAINAGVSRTLSATEAGLGNAGILFGAAGNVNPTRTGIMSMASTFIATQVVCFTMLLVLVVSGVWNTGETGIALVTASYATVFGFLGGWVTTILSVMFGMGVLVAYAFIGRECWFFLTHGRWIGAYYVLYCALAFLGALIDVKTVFCVIAFIVNGLIFCNLYGLLYLLPQMKQGWRSYLEK